MKKYSLIGLSYLTVYAEDKKEALVKLKRLIEASKLPNSVTLEKIIERV